jgi:transcriptional regulator with XRE-family HTH domain
MEIAADARQLLAQARGHQLAETRKQLGLGQKQIAAAMSVGIARVSQIEHGDVTSFEVIARYVEALGDGWTSSPTSVTGPSVCPSLTPQPPPNSTA